MYALLSNYYTLWHNKSKSNQTESLSDSITLAYLNGETLSVAML
jgi:hypothetical protein